MAFKDDLYTAEILPRVENAQERPNGRPLTKSQYEFLNAQFNTEDQLGIITETDGEIRNYAKDVPKIFVMQKDENGYDQMMDLESAGIKLGSFEFWTQAQLGNVFAYPAGDTRPVQIQVDVQRGKNNPRLSFSKPVSPDKIPPAPQPPKPGIFARIGQLFSDRLKQKCVNYDKWLTDQQINSSRLQTNEIIRRSRGQLDTELHEAGHVTEYRTELRSQKKNRSVRDKIEDKEAKHKAKEDGYDNLVSMWKPVPVMKDHLVSTKEAPNRFYTEEQFNKLEKYENLNLKDIKIGGEGLTDEDFTSIAVAAALQPKYASKNPLILKQAGGDYYQILTEIAGMSKEDAQLVAGASFDGCLTRDLMNAGNERGGNGAAIEAMAVPGRKDAKEALEKYNPNDPKSKEELAKIIAFGIRHIARGVENQEGKLQDNVMNLYHMSGNLTKLLDRDPELMELAQTAGMDMKEYKTIKAMAELDRLDTKRTEAKKTLYGAAVGNRPLDEAVKKQALKDILKANLVESTIIAEAHGKTDSPALLEKYKLIKAHELKNPSPKEYQTTEEFEKAQAEYQEENLAAKKANKSITRSGKLVTGTADVLLFSMRELYNPIPEGIVKLGTENGQQQVDAMVDEIIARDKLMSKGTAELGLALQGMNYDGAGLIQKGKTAADAIKARENAPEQDQQPELNKEAEKEKETVLNIG